MKGNQGLEALAALCGRSKAADSQGATITPASVSAAALPTARTNMNANTNANTNPMAHAAIPSAVPSSAANGANLNSHPNPSSDTTNTATAGRSNHCGESMSTNGNVNANANNSIVSVNANAQQQRHSIAPSPQVASAPSAIEPGGLTPQQISQAILAAASSSQGGRIDPLLAQSLFFSSGLRGPGPTSSVDSVTTAPPVPVPNPISATNNNNNSNNLFANTMQQIVIQQYLQAQAAQQQQAQQQAQAQAAAAAANGSHSHVALLAMNIAAGKAGQHQHLLPNATPDPSTLSSTSTGSTDPHRPSHNITSNAQQQAQALLQQAVQQQQQAAQQAQKQQQQQQQQQQQAAQQQAQQQAAAAQQQQQVNQMQHAHPATIHKQQYQYAAATTNASLPSMMKAAAAGGRILPSTVGNSRAEKVGLGTNDARNTNEDIGLEPGNKKQQKRAANRRSAQLSRKRKKQFIEELKEENDELRRKEQILRAIPDLIVVFDSSGKLGFASESVGHFLDVSPEELEGTSFWELICQDSVRLLKAAFMDALAAREHDSDTAVLGSGVWELRLKNKDSQYMLVTLNGVVHFKGDAPECVCCIRPRGEQEQQQGQQEQLAPSKQQLNAIGSNGKANVDGGDAANSKTMNRVVSCSDGDASRSSDGSNGTQQSVLNSRAHAHAHGLSSAAQDEAASDAKKRNKKFRRVMASADDAGNKSSNNNDNNNNNVEADGTNNSVRISDGESSYELSD